MPLFFDLLEKEPESGVGAVLGHWLFGYIHPYPDGNGRMARFLMNMMLASGGYLWTIIRVEDRDAYLAALDRASIDMDIVLFDFIEEMHEKGEPLERALVDAGIMRLRPVMITVGATVLALFPLALHGGPLWKPLCYSQIGGLGVATFITLLLVPVLYAMFVLDLKWVKWKSVAEHASSEQKLS
jgi:hypothetical protein